ncbi:hypothetical protein [Ammoniphilus sp. CFH 90114]|uniref:hypothetical protein n=1 Tax=Ammoniphilus sp. CFH 90114 TaxID=2493665 RepID=UPI00100F8027|nr:hypothetical protein [Ammoniphilus sp. CFH 90114]RXT02857.1 hypothetical protein EIZ39_24000 [Ammoniphilus sp. CFH 90114]
MKSKFQILTIACLICLIVPALSWAEVQSDEAKTEVEAKTVVEATYEPTVEPTIEPISQVSPDQWGTDVNGDGLVDILDWIEAANQVDSKEVLNQIADEIVQ